MSRQMRIGIIMNRIYRETNQQLLSGILKQAYSLGYSAAVFSTQEENQDEDGHYGENNLFSIINFDLFDGFIFVPHTFIKPETIQKITGFLEEKCTKPVLCLGEDYPQFTCTWQDDRAEFKEIVLHLIQRHSCRKIICLTGPVHTQVALAREAGYRDAMREAGLEVGPEDVIYGDFWQPSAVKLGNEIADGVRPRPHAVACANDSMAMNLCDTLIERGIRVPEDVLITGYDGTAQAQYHKPGISTYRTSWLMLGVRSMMKLYEQMMPGETSTACCYDSGLMLENASCGCSPNLRLFMSNTLVDDHVMEQRYLDNNMSNQLLSTENLTDFSKIVNHWVYYVFSPKYYEKEQFDICLCSDWDKVGVDGLAQNYRTDRYSKRVFSLFNKPDMPEETYFSSKDMFPPGYLKEDTVSVSFFAPIHFQRHCFGYAILTLNEVADGFNLHFPRFCKDVSNGLECLCVKNRLKSMTYRAFLSDTRDTLTGVYKASTMPQFWNEMCEKANLYGENLQICMVSVSGLQQINETYGQVEGDQVLMQVAAILMSCCQNGEVCIRSAGNVFLLLGSRGEQSEQTMPSPEEMIAERIERYNQTSGKPYRIHIYTVSETESAQLAPDSDTMYEKMKKLLADKKKRGHSRAEQIYYTAFAQLRRNIYQKPEEDWSVKRCSHILEMSASHFQRLYRSVFGISCMRDVQNSKLCHAKNLLLHTSDTLQSIAEKCGYDYSHFMRLFKKEVGMTPTEYRGGVQLQQKQHEGGGSKRI
ncbi:MAG: substrate-binding domain-containing protein [Ruminococcus sp.]|nr:substrate-binding domain-containing protein [Ruminococcus sp.]